MEQFITYVIGFGGAALALAGFKLYYKQSVSFFIVVLLIQAAVVASLVTLIQFSPHNSIDRLIGVTIIITDIGLAIAFMHKRIALPLKHLTQALDDIAAGHFNPDIEVRKKNQNELDAIARSLQATIDKLQHSIAAANDVALGDLTSQVQTKLTQGDLDETINKMIIQLRNMTTNTKHVAAEVHTQSQHLKETARIVSESSTQEASAIEEVATSLEQISVTNHSNTDHATHASQLAGDLLEEVRAVNRSVNDNTLAMRNILKKTQVVGDIAEKTDILAINAAIEAARAGKMGAGFAVVAHEVRELAETAMHAAKEIHQVTSQSSQTAQTVHQRLDSLTPKIEKTSALIQEISAATSEQNTGIDEINLAMQQLSESAQRNQSEAAHMDTHAQNLVVQAAQLNKSMEYFRTQETAVSEKDSSAPELREQIKHLKSELEQHTKTENKTTADTPPPATE